MADLDVIVLAGGVVGFWAGVLALFKDDAGVFFVVLFVAFGYQTIERRRGWIGLVIGKGTDDLCPCDKWCPCGHCDRTIDRGIGCKCRIWLAAEEFVAWVFWIDGACACRPDAYAERCANVAVSFVGHLELDGDGVAFLECCGCNGELADL